MGITLYGLKNCDTCRKALKAFQAEDIPVTFVDLREDMSWQDSKLDNWFEKVGEKALLNTRSTTWRGLNESERAQPVLDLLKAHSALLKRPLITDGTNVTVGWTKDVQSKWISSV